MQPLKIAIVISHPIQHFCPQYVSFAKKNNVEIKVFFGSTLGYKPFSDSNFKEVISWGNLNLDKFSHVFLNGDKALPVTAELDASSLEHELSVFKPELVISYGYFQKLQRRARKWANQNQVPLAYVADSELRQKRNFFKQILKYPFVRWYLSKVDYALSVGDENERYYRYYGIPSAKLVRMHFPIDVDCYKQSFLKKKELRNQIRNQYGINEADLVLCVVGKLVSWKNQDHIIDAMRLLEQEGIFMHLLVVGSGSMLNDWQQKAQLLQKSKVHFTGFITIEALPAYYAAADIYVHPASAEPHSIAVSEAIYLGCPVILSDTCGSYGPSDDVQQGKNGLVYGFGRISELAASIKKLAADTALREAMSRYSHQLGIQHQKISHDLVLDSLVELIRNNR